LALALSTSTFAFVSAADVPPPDQCMTAGEPCTNAPPDYKSPGTCADSTCTKATPDGSTTYPCTLCQPGGSGGSSGSGGSGGTTGSGGSAGSAGSAGAGTSKDNDDGGCATQPVSHGTSGSVGLLLLGLALGALAFRSR
jgi:hypothetical protein